MDSISNDGQGAGRLSSLQTEWRIRRRVEEAVDSLGSWDITGHGSEALRMETFADTSGQIKPRLHSARRAETHGSLASL